jgi:hypothetical protein
MLTPPIAILASAALLFAWPRFVHGQIAALEAAARQSADRGLGAFRRGHGDESEAARSATHAVHDEIDLGHRPELGKEVLQIVFRRVKGQVPDIQFRVH